jgi:hypothetical protein
VILGIDQPGEERRALGGGGLRPGHDLGAVLDQQVREEIEQRAAREGRLQHERRQRIRVARRAVELREEPRDAGAPNDVESELRRLEGEGARRFPRAPAEDDALVQRARISSAASSTARFASRWRCARDDVLASSASIGLLVAVMRFLLSYSCIERLRENCGKLRENENRDATVRASRFVATA